MYFFSNASWKEFHANRARIISEAFEGKISDEDVFSEYALAQGYDVSGFLSLYEQFSSTTASGISPALPFLYQFGESMKLEAKVNFNSDGEHTDITLSAGLYFAIYDLMNRICCNKAILSHSVDLKEMVWSGTDCFWPEAALMPSIRFSNYEPIDNPEFGKYTGSPVQSSLGLLHCGVPIGDEDRMYTAGLMEFLSLTWIMFHEESHYWHGHIHYLFSNEVAVLDESESFTKDALLLKTFEWEADRNATLDLMNMFFTDRIDPPFELPRYFTTTNSLSWYIRLIICALGSTILIFQKRKLITGVTGFYPSPECRMSTVLGIIYSRLMSIVQERGGILGITNVTEAKNTITDALVTGLYDLLGIEEVFANDVDYEGNIQRVVYEKINPANLRFIEEMPNITKIARGIVRQLDSGDKAINKKWFEEYEQLIESHNYVFNHILPFYRQEAANGRDPFEQS
jgi:hypothetical protein